MHRVLLVLLAVCLQAADYDILIRNARVVDGSGNPWFLADVAVRDGRVVAVGRLTGRSAYRTIEADRRVLAPGSSMYTPTSRAQSRRCLAETTICSTV